jgi:hypothetical protein
MIGVIMSNENQIENNENAGTPNVPATRIISNASIEVLEKLSNRDAALSEVNLMELEVPTFETAEDWDNRFTEALERDPNDIIDKIGRIKKAGAFSSWQAHNTSIDILCRIASHSEDPEFAADPTGMKRNALLHELNLLYHSLPNAGPRRRNFENWVCNFAAPIMQFNPKVAFHPLGKGDLDEAGKPIERLLGKFTLPNNWQTTVSEKADKAFKLKEAAEMPFFRPSEFKPQTEAVPFTTRPVKDVVNPLKNALANQLGFLESAKDSDFVKGVLEKGDQEKIRELKGGNLNKTLFAKTVSEKDTYPKIEIALKAMQAILNMVETNRHVPLEEIDSFCEDIITSTAKWSMEHRFVVAKSETLSEDEIKALREELTQKLASGTITLEEFEKEWKDIPAIETKQEGQESSDDTGEDQDKPEKVEAKTPEEIQAEVQERTKTAQKNLRRQAESRQPQQSKGGRKRGK